MKHTQGKLRQDDCVIRDKNGNMVADCTDYHGDLSEGEEVANAERLVLCWNGYDKEVERANLAEAALVKFEQLAAEEIAGFNALQAKADLHDELEALLEDILEWDGTLPHCLPRIRQVLAKSAKLKE